MTYKFRFLRQDGAEVILEAPNFTDAVNRLAAGIPGLVGTYSFDSVTDDAGNRVSPFTLRPETSA